jgi:predicted MFS family arabinose efflux permease
LLQRVFKAFQYRDFRLMWIGACTSTIGTWMQMVAQQWLVYTLSKDDPFFLGLDGFLGQIPIVLFSLLGGVMADRTDRRKMLLGSQYVQMTTALALSLLTFLGVERVWHILVLSFIVGSAQSFGGPAYSALIPSLVPKENLPNAIALNSIQFNVGRVIGPALGGITLTALGAAWCFGLNGISFIAVIISLYIINAGFTPSKSGESMLTSMKQGIGFIRTQGGMKPLILMSFLMTMMAIPLITFLPVFAKEVLHGSSATFTALLCCSGIGAICGALMVAGMAKTKNQGRTALLMLIVLGVATILFSRSTSILLSCIMIFFAGAAMITVFASITSVVQAITEDGMRGRVMSVYNVAFRGGMPIGMLVVGRLIPIYSAPFTMTVVGSLTIILGLYFLFVQRRIAQL